MRATVKVSIPRDLHEEVKRLVKEGRLRRAGVKNVSDAYELALRLLLRVVEDEE